MILPPVPTKLAALLVSAQEISAQTKFLRKASEDDNDAESRCPVSLRSS